MASHHDALRSTFSSSSLRRSCIVAVLIGTLLNGINQGAEIMDGESPVVWKLLLTYLVPFCVASYGSYTALRTR